MSGFQIARDRPVDVSIELATAADPATDLPRPASGGRPIFADRRDFEYFSQEDVLRLADPDAVALADTRTRRILVSARTGDARGAHVAIRTLVSLSLLELLKRRALYAVHAGCVLRDGRAIVLAGASGCGKTTLTLACLRRGFSFMSDDIALLAEPSAGRLAVHAFPDDVAIGARAAHFLPEIAGRSDESETFTAKRIVAVADLSAPVHQARAIPAALIFPSIKPSAKARLVPLSPDDALIRLVPNVVRTDAVSAQRHLDILALLARSLPAYSLSFDDPHAAAGSLWHLLDGAR